MNYLFTQQYTIIFFCVLVYIGLTLVQLLKTIITTQLDQPMSPTKSLWFVARVVMILPLLWTVKYFV